MGRSEATAASAAWKHKRVFAIVLAFSIIAALVFAAFSADSRFWQANVLIVLRDPSALEGGGTGDRFISEQIAIMRSPIVANAAADSLEESNPEHLVGSDELLEVPTIVGSANSSLVLLSVVDPEAGRAVAMVNALANAYQESSRLEVTQSSVAALKRIDAELDSLDRRLIVIAREIEDERDADVELRQLQTQFRDALTQIAELQLLLPDASGEEASVLRRRITDYRDRIDIYRVAVTTTGASSELQALSQEEDQLIARRTDLLLRRDQITIDVELAPGAVSLLDAAEEATEITDTGTRRILAVGLVLGLVAAFGATYLLELRPRRFADRREPEAILGTPLLADIPSFSAENLRSRLPVRDDPRSAAAESFRFAAASIEADMRTRDFKSVMVVGATLGHGKSTCVVNTAMANARLGHSVLLIDGDFGNQDTTRLVLDDGSPPRVGLIEVVEKEASLQAAVSHVPIGDTGSLSLLSRGSRPTIAANLLSSAATSAIFGAAKEGHDLVFVDAPPLLQVAYASTLAGHVDALVVVVSHGTPVRELEELVNRLKLIDTPVLGYLYNRSPLRPEMKASDGSMADILGQGGIFPSEAPRRPWRRRMGP